VDNTGKFTADVGVQSFVGLEVLKEGNTAVVNYLKNVHSHSETSVLLKVEAYDHKYPYDWRTKKPIIIR
jgi:isoleucyl-tRNA synthetase